MLNVFAKEKPCKNQGMGGGFDFRDKRLKINMFNHRRCNDIDDMIRRHVCL